jgi:tetratricopeptide (TPR) repeat protein
VTKSTSLTIPRRQQALLREAEGYLDLLMLFDDQWPPSKPSRDRLALRTLKVLEPLADAHDRHGQANYLRGQALRLMERHREAVTFLHAAAQRDPASIHIRLALGWCYKRIGRLDLAIQALEEGLRIDPDQGIIHYNLACYWSLAKNARLALQYLAQSIDLDPTYRKMVDSEPDFDPIRSDPEFVTLTGSGVTR